MRVEVAYRGRIEAFDTDRFTEAQPFSGKSMLADLTLDYADVEKKGLWLTAHCYAANEAYRTDGGEAPEARREKGWRFQLATPREAAGIESVTLDGSTVLARLFGELVDVARVDRACALFVGPGGSLASRIVRLSGYLANDDERQARRSWRRRSASLRLHSKGRSRPKRHRRCQQTTWKTIGWKDSEMIKAVFRGIGAFVRWMFKAVFRFM